MVQDHACRGSLSQEVIAKMTSGKMDDPVEASFEAWQPDSTNLGERLSNLALSFTGIKFPPAKLFQILKDQFDRGSKFQRIDYLLTGIRLGFRSMQSEIGEVAEQVNAVNAKLEGDRFREAVSVACEEAARATNDKKIEQMAAALVSYVRPTPSAWAAPDEDIASMIRDIAQLGDRDIQVLEILASVHAGAVSHMPNLQDPDAFSRETPKLKTAIAESGIHPDDFLSTCERLRGFGLGAEVLRNTSHMGPQDFCYRPTRRGLLLLDYLKNVAKVTPV
jgi:hypothetical protein